jgi:hypothetical protein
LNERERTEETKREIKIKESKKFYFLLNLVLLLEYFFQSIRSNLMKLKFGPKFVLENLKNFGLKVKRKLELKTKGDKG